jgi:hypothetical protein
MKERHLVQISPLSIRNKWWVPHCPDFLQRLVALIHSMRLSLMKGAHADLSSTAWQEIGVKPYFGLSGIHRAGPTNFSTATDHPQIHGYLHPVPVIPRGVPLPG